MTPAPASSPEAELAPWARALGAVLWPSFFAAGVATSVCFALVDPLVLRDISFPTLEITRELGYSLGFFVFWALTCSSSAFSVWLVLPPGALWRTGKRTNDNSTQPRA